MPKVISPKNEATKLPLWSTLISWLVLDRTQPPQWVWGVVGTIFALIWIASIVGIIRQEHVDIFKDKA